MRDNNARLHEQFAKWWKTRSAADRDLHAQAFRYEATHFADVRLETASARRSLFRYEAQGDGGGWTETTGDPPLVSVDGWIICRARLKPPTVGRCECRKRTIRVSDKLAGDEMTACLLHEMMHAYEFQLPRGYAEWLVLDLHRRLLRRLPRARVQRCVDASTHTLSHEHAHGVLFLLKSLELDLRHGWPLGFVFGYGRPDLLK